MTAFKQEKEEVLWICACIMLSNNCGYKMRNKEISLTFNFKIIHPKTSGTRHPIIKRDNWNVT